MTRRQLCGALLGVVLLVTAAGPLAAQDAKPIQLPAPQKTGGMPLMQALSARQSAREFGTTKLPMQVLSSLLWAAWGINRPDGHRTAPSAQNWQEMDVYVALSEGLYLYDAKAHALNPIAAEDLRGATGTQPFPADAALNLIYVADLAKTRNAQDPARSLYIGAHSGFISQNVYLFCASEGLNTVVRASVDRAALAKKMRLRPDQQITFAQSVGYPKGAK